MKKKTTRMIIATIIVVFVLFVLFFLNKRGQTDIIVDDSIPRLTVTSSAFDNLGVIPDQHTGRGEDISPGFDLPELTKSAESIAIIMDDLDVPWKANYTHWVIWNIPAIAHIPQDISYGVAIPELDGAVQGVAFGRNRYRGPMPPFGTHRYQFHVFALDTTLDLDSSSVKTDLLDAMKGHILQYGSLTGWYPREANQWLDAVDGQKIEYGEKLSANSVRSQGNGINTIAYQQRGAGKATAASNMGNALVYDRQPT